MNSAIIILISLVFVPLLIFVPPMIVSKVVEVPEDYSSIQLAIDEANPSDVIQIASGMYFENLKITKPIRLVGEGQDRTVVVGTGTGILVKADNVEISGLTVQDGIYGVFLWHSTGTTLRNVAMRGNKWNFGVWGTSLAHFIQDIDSSNTADEKPIYFWLNQHDRQVPEDAGYVALVNSTNIIVRDMNLTSNEQGVLLVNTWGSIIENVTMLGNDEGIVLRMSNNNTVRENNLFSINWHGFYLVSSYNNTLYENTIANCTYGMSTEHSSENAIYHNNFIGNKKQIYQLSSSNVWHNLVGEGNYWSDYNGTDTDGNGIGDTFVPHSGVDYQPLMSVYDAIPPLAHAGAGQTVFESISVNFDASNSTDNIGIANYFWDFGDGSVGTGVTATHIYTVAGNYTVTLTVRDVASNTAIDTTTVIVVKNPGSFEWWIVIAGASVGALALTAIILWVRRFIREEKKP